LKRTVLGSLQRLGQIDPRPVRAERDGRERARDRCHSAGDAEDEGVVALTAAARAARDDIEDAVAIGIEDVGTTCESKAADFDACRS
jgi:hypothetical protein